MLRRLQGKLRENFRRKLGVEARRLGRISICSSWGVGRKAQEGKEEPQTREQTGNLRCN